MSVFLYDFTVLKPLSKQPYSELEPTTVGREVIVVFVGLATVSSADLQGAGLASSVRGNLS